MPALGIVFVAHIQPVRMPGTSVYSNCSVLGPGVGGEGKARSEVSGLWSEESERSAWTLTRRQRWGSFGSADLHLCVQVCWARCIAVGSMHGVFLRGRVYA